MESKMGLREYQAATELIHQHSHLQDFAGPRSPELVAVAEHALGVTFPPSYRRFLLEYGAGGFGSDSFKGVINDDFEHSSDPDVVWIMLNGWRSGFLPQELVEIYAVGDGEVFCLDLSVVRADGESPIIAFTPGFPLAAQTWELIADDFGSFLLIRVQYQLTHVR